MRESEQLFEGHRPVGGDDAVRRRPGAAGADGEHRGDGEHAAGAGQHLGILENPSRRGEHHRRDQAKASTATEAVAANKTKTEKLLAAIRAAGIRERDIQTQGIQLQPDYRWDNEPGGRGHQTLVGYIASNSVQVKTRDIDKLTSLLDSLTTAGADTVYGPNFAISDPAPLRKEARIRAMARGQEEATEFARNNGYTSVRLLSVEEGVSYRGTDIAVTGSRIMNASAPPPPPPPPAPERDGGIVAPGQLETGVTLNLLYRMER